MPGTFPTTPGYAAIRTRRRHFNLSSESLSGRRQVRSLASRRREFTIVFPPMTRTEFDPIWDFIDLQDGMLGTFTLTIFDPASDSATMNVTCRFAGDVQEFDLDNASLYRFEVDVEEVI